MSFEKFYNDLIRDNFTYELSKHFYCSNESYIKIPKDVLQEKEMWIVYLISNDKKKIITHLYLNCLTNEFNSKGLRLANGTEEFLQYNGPEQHFKIIIRRMEIKKSNPLEDKIKMLQDQIDELKKQVIL